jgi:hypothetical protein
VSEGGGVGERQITRKTAEQAAATDHNPHHRNGVVSLRKCTCHKDDWRTVGCHFCNLSEALRLSAGTRRTITVSSRDPDTSVTFAESHLSYHKVAVEDGVRGTLRRFSPCRGLRDGLEHVGFQRRGNVSAAASTASASLS